MRFFALALLLCAVWVAGAANLTATPEIFELGEGWSASAGALQCDTQGDAYAWATGAPLSPGWKLRLEATIGKRFSGEGQSAALSLGVATEAAPSTPALLFNVESRTEGKINLTAQYLAGGEWIPLYASDWIVCKDDRFTLEAEYTPGNRFLDLRLWSGSGWYTHVRTRPFNQGLLAALRIPGARVYGGEVQVAQLEPTELPQPAVWQPPADLATSAKRAGQDLLANYWVGDAATGHIIETYYGFRREDAPRDDVRWLWENDARGGIWERGTLVFALAALYDATGDADLLTRLKAEYAYTRGRYTAEEIDSAPGTTMMVGCDDVGWDAWYFLTLYRYTRDQWALDRARVLTEAAFARWEDTDLGGGLWYNDHRQAKSTYQAALILLALTLWELTDDDHFLALAMPAYNWTELACLRPDGLYWCDYGWGGPVGKERPNDIHEAGSVSFLGGNMMMGVVNARLYRATGQPEYLARALRTVEAISAHETTEGVLLNDRDAWANSAFAPEWVREVLTLPGCPAEARALLVRTAEVIAQRSRTPEGFYSPCWLTHPAGEECPWLADETTAQQIMTSCTTATFLIAATLGTVLH